MLYLTGLTKQQDFIRFFIKMSQLLFIKHFYFFKTFQKIVTLKISNEKHISQFKIRKLNITSHKLLL
jgi:hypothetical protein